MNPTQQWMTRRTTLRRDGEVTMSENALAALASLLWDQRQRLEQLLFALVTQQLIISSGNSRWLGYSDTAITTAIADIQDAEVMRALQTAQITADLGVDDDISLAELADNVDEPWAQTLRDHRTALRALTTEIDGAVAENRRLLTAGAQAIGDALDKLGSFASTYDASGITHHGDGPALFDRQA